MQEIAGVTPFRGSVMQEQELVPQLTRQSYSLYIQDGVICQVPTIGKPPIRWVDRQFPGESAIERVDYAIERPTDPARMLELVDVAIIGGLHADEEESPYIVSTVLPGYVFPRLVAYNVNIHAGLHGKHGAIFPLQNGMASKTNASHIQFHQNGEVVGHMVNLNRQFPLPATIKTWEDTKRAVTFPEARLLLDMLKRNPVKFLFSFHEDTIRQGPYYYEIVPDARHDPFAQQSFILHGEVVTNLLKKGFRPFSGIDDTEDPSLGYFVRDGRVIQSIIDESGNLTNDTTFEMAAVELGRCGLTEGKRAFVIEIPGDASFGQKQEIISVFMDSLIVPFLRMQGVNIPS